jgi:hypothetical protein
MRSLGGNSYNPQATHHHSILGILKDTPNSLSPILPFIHTTLRLFDDNSDSSTTYKTDNLDNLNNLPNLDNLENLLIAQTCKDAGS